MRSAALEILASVEETPPGLIREAPPQKRSQEDMLTTQKVPSQEIRGLIDRYMNYEADTLRPNADNVQSEIIEGERFEESGVDNHTAGPTKLPGHPALSEEDEQDSGNTWNVDAVSTRVLDNQTKTRYGRNSPRSTDVLWEGPGPTKPFIIYPDNPFKTTWDLMQILVLSYVALVVPVRVCFSIETYGAEFIVDCLVDLYFYLDIYINFVSAFKVEEGIEIFVVDDFREIAMKYVKTWFALDIAACLPLEYVTRLQSGTLGCSFTSCEDSDSSQSSGSGGGALKLLKILRIFRLMKLVRLARVQRLLKRYEDSLIRYRGLVIVAKIMGTIFISSHWLGCLYGAVYDWDTFKGFDKGSTDSNGGEVTTLDKWVASFYWAVQTTTTVGYGDLTTKSYEGQLASAFAMIIGGVVFSWFMSAVMDFLCPDPAAVAHQETMRYVVRYVEESSLPKPTASRLLAYYRRRGATEEKSAFDETKMLKALAPSLRHELFDCMYSESIRSAPIIKDQDDDFINALIMAINPIGYEECDIVYHEGDTAEEMLILVSGKISLLQNLNSKHVVGDVVTDTSYLDSNTVTTLEAAGAYFGEEAVFRCRHRLFFAVARHAVKLLSVSCAALWPLLEECYPQAHEDMQRLFIGKLERYARQPAMERTVQTMQLGSLLDPEGELKRNWRALLSAERAAAEPSTAVGPSAAYGEINEGPSPLGVFPIPSGPSAKPSSPVHSSTRRSVPGGASADSSRSLSAAATPRSNSAAPIPLASSPRERALASTATPRAHPSSGASPKSPFSSPPRGSAFRSPRETEADEATPSAIEMEQMMILAQNMQEEMKSLQARVAEELGDLKEQVAFRNARLARLEAWT